MSDKPEPNDPSELAKAIARDVGVVAFCDVSHIIGPNELAARVQTHLEAHTQQHAAEVAELKQTVRQLRKQLLTDAFPRRAGF